MKRIIQLLAMAAIVVSSGYAQRGFFGFHYSTGLGLGEQADYISKFSWQGWGMEGRSFVSDDITIGGLWGIQTFHEELPDAVASEGTISVKGNQYRYINAMPFMLTTHKYFGEPEKQFFVGTGLGVYKVNAETQIGLWVLGDDSWAFGLMPELGVMSQISPDASVYFSTRFNWALRNSPSNDWQYLTFNIGMAFE
jgi:hypothetical protein